MTEPEIEKLYPGDTPRYFRRAEVARAIAHYTGAQEATSAHYTRAGRVLLEGVRRGVIIRTGSGRYRRTPASARFCVWIPCCLRMPESHQQVLVYLPDRQDRKQISTDHLTGGNWTKHRRPGDITHWMLLPPAPHKDTP